MTLKVKCCRQFRLMHVTDDAIVGGDREPARRDRADGRRRSARSRSAASAPTSWCARARTSNWPRARSASTGSTSCRSGATGDVVDVDVDGGLFVGHLHSGAGPRSRRRTGSRADISRHCGAPGSVASGSIRPAPLDELAEHPQLSYSLDEACLLAFPRRDMSADQTVDVGHGRALEPAGIDGVYAAVAPDGRVMALLEDDGRREPSRWWCCARRRSDPWCQSGSSRAPRDARCPHDAPATARRS